VPGCRAACGLQLRACKSGAWWIERGGDAHGKQSRELQKSGAPPGEGSSTTRGRRRAWRRSPGVWRESSSTSRSRKRARVDARRPNAAGRKRGRCRALRRLEKWLKPTSKGRRASIAGDVARVRHRLVRASPPIARRVSSESGMPDALDVRSPESRLTSAGEGVAIRRARFAGASRSAGSRTSAARGEEFAHGAAAGAARSERSAFRALGGLLASVATAEASVRVATGWRHSFISLLASKNSRTTSRAPCRLSKACARLRFAAAATECARPAWCEARGSTRRAPWRAACAVRSRVGRRKTGTAGTSAPNDSETLGSLSAPRRSSRRRDRRSGRTCLAGR